MTDNLTINLNADEGVYFSPKEYPGIIRRLVILLIDSIVLIIMWVIAAAIFTPTSETNTFFSAMLSVFISLFIPFFYLVLIKASKMRTLGFVLTGVKIINFRGQKPTWLEMTLRFFSLGMYLLQYVLIIDLVWIWDDENKLSLRDRLTGTYLITKNAVPIGKGKIINHNYFLGTFSLICSEVIKEKDG